VATWAEVTAAAPELARAARGFLDAGVHKTLATLRRDGAPRISGTEVYFVWDDLWFGSMWMARKARDLRADPRFALHSASPDPPSWRGDATVSGRVEEVTDPRRIAEFMAVASPEQPSPPGQMHLFRADVREVLVVRLGEPADHLEITVWNPARGVRRMTRR
jgi:Pyridoxamine 5'-phosphate oxidase